MNEGENEPKQEKRERRRCHISVVFSLLFAPPLRFGRRSLNYNASSRCVLFRSENFTEASKIERQRLKKPGLPSEAFSIFTHFPENSVRILGRNLGVCPARLLTRRHRFETKCKLTPTSLLDLSKRPWCDGHKWNHLLGRGAGAVSRSDLSCRLQSEGFDPCDGFRRCDNVSMCRFSPCVDGNERKFSVSCLVAVRLKAGGRPDSLNSPSALAHSTSCLVQTTSTSTCGKSRRIQKQVGFFAPSVADCMFTSLDLCIST